MLALLQAEERYGFEFVKALGEVAGPVTIEGTICPLLTRLRREADRMTNVQDDADQESRVRGREVIALLLLLFGGLVIFAWFIGVYLLWTSDRWKLSEKLLGMVIWPFGFVGAIAILRIDISMPTWLEIVVGAIILLAPLTVTAVLLKNAQPGRAALADPAPR